MLSALLAFIAVGLTIGGFAAETTGTVTVQAGSTIRYRKVN